MKSIRPIRRSILWSALGLAAAAALAVILLIVLPPAGSGVPAPVAPAERISSTDRERGIIAPAPDRAILISRAGTVEVFTDGAWRPVEIGAYLGAGRRLRTAASSSCELQFGDRGIVRVDEKTELAIERAAVAAGRTDVALGLSSGRLLCRVAKLSTPEHFQVKTMTAVCGVRGTIFAVKAENGGEVTISVREGSVFFVPPAVDPAVLRSRLAEANEPSAARFDRLKSSAPAVSAGQETFLTDAFAAAAAADTRAFSNGIEKILSSPAAGRAADLDSLIAAFTAGLKAKTPHARPLPPDAADTLAPLERAFVLPVSATAAAVESTETGREAPAASPLVIFELSVKPEDAEIRLAGRAVGRVRFEGIFRENDRLDFTFQREGYADAAFTVNVTPGIRPVLVEMEKPPSSSQTPTTSSLSKPKPSPIAAVKNDHRLGAPFIFLTEFNGHEYYLDRTMLLWTTASDRCVKNGGHLVTITSAAENEALIKAIRAQNIGVEMWIGYTIRSSVSWRWVTGEKSDFTYWDSWQPDNPGSQVYATMYRTPDACRWNDCFDYEVHYYILELEPADGGQ